MMNDRCTFAHRQENSARKMIFLLVICFAALPHSSGISEWCYYLPECNSTTWPVNYAQFCSGSSQSPINIVTANVQANASLTSFNFTGFDDNSTFMSLTNTGESAQVNLDGSKMSVQGGGLPGLYIPKQFHFHWGNSSFSPGSEHTVDGKKYAMEMHIVNINSKYNSSIPAALAANDSSALAVLGFFIEGTSEANQTKGWDVLTSFLSSIPFAGNTNSHIMNQITLNSLLQGVDTTKYYRYQGSLTTPTCNEVVIWTVFKQPIKVSNNLINRFSTNVFYSGSNNTVLITNNFRGVQMMNNRVVTSQTSASTAPTASLSVLTLLLLSSVCWL